jgi:hypothetical protein
VENHNYINLISIFYKWTPRGFIRVNLAFPFLRDFQDKNHMCDLGYIHSKHRYTNIYDSLYPNITTEVETAGCSLVYNVSVIHFNYWLVIMLKLNFLHIILVIKLYLASK